MLPQKENSIPENKPSSEPSKEELRFGKLFEPIITLAETVEPGYYDFRKSQDGLASIQRALANEIFSLKLEHDGTGTISIEINEKGYGDHAKFLIKDGKLTLTENQEKVWENPRALEGLVDVVGALGVAYDLNKLKTNSPRDTEEYIQ